METESLDSHLSRAASCLDSANFQAVIADLRFCEQALVAKRFARATGPGGAAVRVRVPAADAALIHVTRAITLINPEHTQLEEIKQSIESARSEVAHLA
jgi:hypothetical protein